MLSGVDLPLKSQDEIHRFFDEKTREKSLSVLSPLVVDGNGFARSIIISVRQLCLCGIIHMKGFYTIVEKIKNVILRQQSIAR